jgi:hypothetical protein
MVLEERIMGTITPENELSNRHIARQIVTAMVGTAKKINLYSESHSVYHSALKKLKNMFDVYFGRFGNFRIHIQRNRIVHHNKILYEGNLEPFDMAFLLHRDGILWLEFQVDLELYEIDAFFRILHDHGMPVEEPEDDIVTALWEFNLPSILYEAADLELDLADNLSIGAESDRNAPNEGAEENKASIRKESLYSNIATCALSDNCKDDFWQLSAEERKQLRQMIAAEEKLDGSDYVTDALLYILEVHPSEEDIEALLETLLQELREILMNARFGYLARTFVKLKKIATHHAHLNWIKPYFDQLFASLSGRPLLNGLLKIPVDAYNFDDTQKKDLKRFLLMLDPSAIMGLGPIVSNIQSVELQHIILETIRCMAASDFRPLEKLIAENDAVLICPIVHVLGSLKDCRSRQMLIKLLHHPSELVRLQALKAILTRDNQAINDIFPLIDDPDERIRAFVLRQLGRRRCGVAEGKILEYLKIFRPRAINNDHFLAICRTLGQCGSERSVPYLSQLLFKWPMLGILRSAGSPHRKGAIVALKALRTKKAAILLERQQRGFFGNILRSATYHSFGLGAGEHQNVQ